MLDIGTEEKGEKRKETEEPAKQGDPEAIDKTYEMPKSVISYRKPRRLSEEIRASMRQRMEMINKS